MKTRLIFPLALAALFAAPSHSQSAENGEKGTFTVTPSFVSDYVWRGQRLGGFSFQPTFSYEKGPWNFELFANLPLDEKMSETVFPEFDFSASYEFSFANDFFKIRPSLIAYTYPNTEVEIHKTIFEPNVSLAFSLKDLSLSLNLYYDLTQKGPTYEVEAGYTIPLAERVGIELSALAGKFELTDVVPNAVPKEKFSGSYWHAGISVPIELTERMAIVPGWQYAKGYDRFFQTGNEGCGAFSLNFSYSF